MSRLREPRMRMCGCVVQRRHRKVQLVYACGKCPMTKGIVAGWRITDAEEAKLKARCGDSIRIDPKLG